MRYRDPECSKYKDILLGLRDILLYIFFPRKKIKFKKIKKFAEDQKTKKKYVFEISREIKKPVENHKNK